MYLSVGTYAGGYTTSVPIKMRSLSEEEFIQNCTTRRRRKSAVRIVQAPGASRQARFVTRWDHHAVAQRRLQPVRRRDPHPKLQMLG